MKRSVLLLSTFLPLLGNGCGDGSRREANEPSTPQEMYARVQELITPTAERPEPDTAEAIRWLTKAAEAGHLQAMTDLGGLYLEGGKGVEPDGKLALKWFTLAAERGHTPAYIFMGRILYSGLHGAAEPEQAMLYWRKAADAGIPEAHFYIGSALIRDAATAAKGAKHLETAATQGKGRLAASAATLLGSLYSKGMGGIQADAATSLTWYRRAAKAGNPKAQLVYALMLLTGSQVDKDKKEGMAYLRMAAGQDYPQAIALLINLLRNGENAAQYEAEAAAWEKRLESLRQTPAAEQ